MLQSRKLSQRYEPDRESKPRHSTTIQDLRDKLRVENRLHISQKSKNGGILQTIRNFGKAANNANRSVSRQAKKMPSIFDGRAP